MPFNIGLMTMTMRRRQRRAFALTMLFIIFSLFFANLRAYGGEGGKIDLYTNKVPFDGRGINQRSDAFQPQELVVLYARVTYNDAPIINWFVAFQILNPLNKTVAICANSTDEDGIATFSFRVPWPSEGVEHEVFGDWMVVATTSIADKVFMDTLTFRVGWIIQVINIETLNVQLTPQIGFLRDETVVLNLTIRNIALTNKFAAIVVDVFDIAKYLIIHEIYENKLVAFQPGDTAIQIISKIPESATIGNATIIATAYTDLPERGGVTYSPPCLSYFTVLTRKQYYLAVKTDPPGIVSIPGEGWYDEGTAVSLTAPDIVMVSTGVRYKFSHWDVDGISWTGNPINVVMNKNHTATAHYILQYYLSVRTSPTGIAVIPGEGWYDAGVNVSLSAPPVRGYDFDYWDVDGVSKPAGVYRIVVYMDGPHTATAHYRVREAEWLYLVLLAILILLIILLCVLAYRRIKRRRRAGEEAFYRGWTAWYYYGYNLREKGRKF